MLTLYGNQKQLVVRSPSQDSDSSATAIEDLTPGPLDPERCTASGPGFAGGAAGSPVYLNVMAKDARGIRLKEGGAKVDVYVEALMDRDKLIEVTIKDNGNGSYTATYTAPVRGDYKLSIMINGVPIGGSPFPVFFSPPRMADIAASLLVSDRFNAQEKESLINQTVGNATQALGGTIENSLYVANISPSIQIDQLRQLFKYCGKVVNVHFVSESKETALVEFSSALEAGCALGLNNVEVGDRPLVCQLAKDVILSRTKPASTNSVYQNEALAQAAHNTNQIVAQLASLRAIAKTTLLPAIEQEEKKYEGKKAAFAAIAEISRKIARKQREGSAYEEESEKHHKRSKSRTRSRSRSRSKRRRRERHGSRSGSLTTPERKLRRRDRSRSEDSYRESSYYYSRRRRRSRSSRRASKKEEKRRNKEKSRKGSDRSKKSKTKKESEMNNNKEVKSTELENNRTEGTTMTTNINTKMATDQLSKEINKSLFVSDKDNDDMVSKLINEILYDNLSSGLKKSGGEVIEENKTIKQEVEEMEGLDEIKRNDDMLGFIGRLEKKAKTSEWVEIIQENWNDNLTDKKSNEMSFDEMLDIELPGEKEILEAREMKQKQDPKYFENMRERVKAALKKKLTKEDEVEN